MKKQSIYYKEMVLVVLMVYAFLNLLGFAKGAAWASYDNKGSPCMVVTRMDFVFPGVFIGCWANQPIMEWKNL